MRRDGYRLAADLTRKQFAPLQHLRQCGQSGYFKNGRLQVINRDQRPPRGGHQGSDRDRHQDNASNLEDCHRHRRSNRHYDATGDSHYDNDHDDYSRGDDWQVRHGREDCGCDPAKPTTDYRWYYQDCWGYSYPYHTDLHQWPALQAGHKPSTPPGNATSAGPASDPRQ